jgi:hypothetical protein
VIAALRAIPDLAIRSVTTRDAGDGVIVQADVEGADLHSRLAELADRHEVAGVDVGG